MNVVIRNGAASRTRPVAQPAHFRTDVQALRTVAITAVVLNHLWPHAVPGGYIGVDVFFVISGFLITSHLLRELTDTGRVRLGAFYARRIRRLLPAALLVLLISVVLVAIFLPYPRWDRNAAEIAASAGYVENWFLAAMSVNYSALNDSATVAQHYWSLSVEEQFYLLWPLLLLVAAWVARRRGGSLRAQVALALAIVGLSSLAASVVFTQVAPAQAYFVTFTRAWEFAMGGAVALVASRLPLSRGWAGLLAAAGLLSIAAAALSFDSTTPFPGVAALVPVLGTAAIIVAGTRRERLWHAPLSESRPVQWVGAASYSLYLWHWPLIVVAPFVIGGELSTPTKLVVLALSVVLAGVTRALVEGPAQRWRWWSGSVRRSLVGMAAGMTVVFLACGALFGAYTLRAAADSPTAPLVTGTCVGPAALANPQECADPFGPADSVVMTARNEYFHTPAECGQLLEILKAGDKLTTFRCDFSDGAPTANVWLVGDSHAQQWQGAIFDIAREKGWVVTTSLLGGCPVADIHFAGFRVPWNEADIEMCRTWSRDVAQAVVDDQPDVVFTSLASRAYLLDDGSGRPAIDQLAEGLRADWKRWADAGARVVAIADPPLNGDVRPPDCVLLNKADPLVCARPRDEAQPPDAISRAASPSDEPSIVVVDFTSSFCDERSCYAVVGGVPVYFDADHLNLQFARFFAGSLAAAAGDDAG